MALNRSAKFKVVIIQIVYESQSESAWGLIKLFNKGLEGDSI